MSGAQRYIKNYFKRFAEQKPLIEEPIAPSTDMIIVIPCHNEPDLLGTLNSLLQSALPDCGLEVIVVVNNSESVDLKSEIRHSNLRTINAFKEWKMSNLKEGIAFHLIEALDLAKKHAGVGLARKIGMDEALRRFASVGKIGSIVCLDADCRVSKTYLTAIHEEFHLTEHGIGEMHYEHPYELEEDEALKQGIINYELHLRYYVDGLQKAGFPNAIQTVGSCMLVKSDIYAKHGGMNKRKAGEDFYFLHKIIPHEKFITVKRGTVFPSCRISDRVPFGTGKAQQDWIDQKERHYLTYAPEIFEELKTLLDSIDQVYDDDRSSLSPIVLAFFEAQGYWPKVDLIRKNSKRIDQFKKQFYIWFDGFLCMKFMHYCRDHFYPNIPLKEACSFIYPQQETPESYLKVARKNE